MSGAHVPRRGIEPIITVDKCIEFFLPHVHMTLSAAVEGSNGICHLVRTDGAGRIFSIVEDVPTSIQLAQIVIG
jgi:hypothetical protein